MKAPSTASTGDRASQSDPVGSLDERARRIFAGIADLPTIRLLRLPSSLAGARQVARGSWVRTIIAIGPQHLRRVVERAAGLLDAPAAPDAHATSSTPGEPP